MQNHHFRAGKWDQRRGGKRELLQVAPRRL